MKKDKRTVRALKEGLRARSAYKLVELNNKYKFLEKAKKAIDLGSWPGGWSVVASKYCPVVSVDLSEMPATPNCTCIQADIFDDSLLDELPFVDVVMSDVAPRTAGDSRDQYKSFLLSMRSLEIAIDCLRVNGSFVCKTFQGEDTQEFLEEARRYFGFVKMTKPASSKKASKEMYLVAMKFKGRNE